MTVFRTLTGDLERILGTSPRSAMAFIDYNVLAPDALVDLDANKVYPPGPDRIPLNADGTFSVQVIDSGAAGTNVPAGSLRCTVTVHYVDAARQRRTWTCNNFAVTADLDLSDAVETADPPATAANQYLVQMQAMLDQAELIAGLTGEDGAVAALLGDDTSATYAASDATNAAQVADPASLHRAALTAEFAGQAATGVVAPANAQKIEQVVGEMRRAKGGRIGTAGKGVISLRIDHKLDAFRATFASMFDERGLPFSIGVVTQSIGNPSAPYEPSTTTWSDINDDILTIGGELWAHSRTHANPTPPATLYDEIVGSKIDIETNLPDAVVMGWQQPGGPSTYGEPHVTPEGMDDEAGRLIRGYFPLYETSIIGSGRRALPTDGCCGLNHVTIDTQSLAWGKEKVDEAIEHQVGIQIMCHPSYLGTPGYMTAADYELFLDYIVEKRDAGQLEVLTASGLAFADPATAHRLEFVSGGSFAGEVTGQVPRAWDTFTPAAAWTIQHDGGRPGAEDSDYLRIPAGQGLAITNPTAGQFGVAGHVVRFRGWVRSLDGSPPDWRVTITSADKDSDHVTNTVIRTLTGTTTGTWTKIERCFTLKKGYGSIFVTIGKAAGVTTGTIDFDDISVVPV